MGGRFVANPDRAGFLRKSCEARCGDNFCCLCVGRELQLAGVVNSCLAEEGADLPLEERRLLKFICLCLLLSVPKAMKGLQLAVFPELPKRTWEGRLLSQQSQVCSI